MTKLYKCDICGRNYETEEQAIACEKSQTIISAKVFGNSTDGENHPVHIDVTFANGDVVRYGSGKFHVDTLLTVAKNRR